MNGETFPILLQTAPVRNKDGDVVGLLGICKDITDRKQAESAIQRLANEQSILLSTVPAMIFWIDRKGTFVRVNNAFAAALHTSPDDIKGKSLFDLYPEDMARAYYNDNVKVMESGAPKRDIEEPVETPTDTIWVSTDKIPHRDEKGNIIGIIGFSENITARKQAEEKLRESEERYELATKSGMVGVWDWNLETNEIYLDPNLKAMLGYEDNEIRNHLDDWGRFVHPDDMESVMAEAKAHLEGLKPQYEIAHRMLHKDGTIIWFLARGTAIRDANGKPYRVLGTDTDITERKQAEEFLRESKEKLAGIIASVSDHMSMMDEEHNIVWANDVAKRLFGPDIIGKKCYSTYHRFNEVCQPCIVEKTFADGKVHEHETEVIGADGKKMIFWCKASVAARHEDGRPKLVVEISRDITIRKRTEKALRESMEKYRSIIEGIEELL